MVSFGVEPDRVTLYQLVKQIIIFLACVAGAVK